MAIPFLARQELKEGVGEWVFVLKIAKNNVAPHYSERPIEILWVSLARKHQKPLYFGVYYGVQESTSVESVRTEMAHLAEEIAEMKNEGEVILCMDANAKTGLMGEEPSRNGRMMQEVFEECGIVVMNKTGKCKGVVTRQNRSKEEEKSANPWMNKQRDSYEPSAWNPQYTGSQYTPL